MALREIFPKLLLLLLSLNISSRRFRQRLVAFALYSGLFTALSALLVDVQFLSTYEQRQPELELSDFAEHLRLFQQLTFT